MKPNSMDVSFMGIILGEKPKVHNGDVNKVITFWISP
jgi:hypothetical protein